MLVIGINKPTRFEFVDANGDIGAMEVSVLSNGKARVAFDFPRSVAIWRGENAAKIRAQRDSGKTNNPRSASNG